MNRLIKKTVFGVVGFVVIYTLFVQIQVLVMRHFRRAAGPTDGDNSVSAHKVYSFSFAKYTPAGKKEIEIEGDSADILSETVHLMNVMAKAYAEEAPVTITADKGDYNKSANEVDLNENVVATTEDGTRLLTEKLKIFPSENVMETDVPASVKKDNIHIDGLGARGDSGLKKMEFHKNVTVIVQDPEEKSSGPTTITCDGPLVIDYDKNIARFKENVVAEDSRGKLTADTMDVYYNKDSRRVSKIMAVGNVVIENPDGSQTFSDNVVYFAEEGRIILGGDAEALYKEGSDFDHFEGGALGVSSGNQTAEKGV